MRQLNITGFILIESFRKTCRCDAFIFQVIKAAVRQLSVIDTIKQVMRVFLNYIKNKPLYTPIDAESLTINVFWAVKV